MPIFVH